MSSVCYYSCLRAICQRYVCQQLKSGHQVLYKTSTFQNEPPLCGHLQSKDVFTPVLCEVWTKVLQTMAWSTLGEKYGLSPDQGLNLCGVRGERQSPGINLSISFQVQVNFINSFF